MENFNFWDTPVWGTINLFVVVFVSLFLANALKRAFPFLKKSLIPLLRAGRHSPAGRRNRLRGDYGK